MVSTKPEIAVLYILDVKKLDAAAGLRAHFEAVKKYVRGLRWELREVGPLIEADEIARAVRSLQARYDGLLGVTFTGTSARQTANLLEFNGPVASWFFPETPWWSMASAGSGIGAIRDEAEVNPNLKLFVIAGGPGSTDVQERLDVFASVVHAMSAMREEKVGLVGGSYTEVMPASNWHPDVLTSKYGPAFADVSITVLRRFCDEVTDGEVSTLIQEMKARGFTVRESEAVRMSAKASLALEKLQVKYGCTGIALNCYGGPDPEGYTGILGACGASACLKGHALGTAIIGCESDVVMTMQQMLFRHLTGRVPCVADPWMVERQRNLLHAGTCSGPLELADSPEECTVEEGTRMSLYKVGVLGVAFPKVAPAGCLVARIAGRNLETLYLASGRLLGTDTREKIPGRLCLTVELKNVSRWLDIGCNGNHYTFLPTRALARDIAKLKLYCEYKGIKLVECD